MREFELLPDEEQIRKMAIEYSRLKSRSKVLSESDTTSETLVATSNEVATDDKNLTSDSAIKTLDGHPFGDPHMGGLYAPDGGHHHGGGHGGFPEWAMPICRHCLPPNCWQHLFPKHPAPPKKPCPTLPQDVERLYFLQVDILTALCCLLERNLNHATKEQIEHLIEIKQCTKNQVCDVFYKLCGHGISYAPRLFCHGGFCNVLKEVSCLQTELLAQLDKVERCACGKFGRELSSIRAQEFTATSIINHLSVYCRN